MKKIVFLSVFALISAFTTLESCKKSEAVEASSNSPKTEVFDDDGTIEEKETEDVPDIVDYDSEATTKVISLAPWDGYTNAKVGEADNDTWCSTLKYKNFFKTDNDGTWSSWELLLSQTDTINSATIDNAGLELVDFERNSPTKYTFVMSALTDTFKVANVKFTFTTNKGKLLRKTVKIVGVKNGGTKIYGLQQYGLTIEGVSSNNLTATGTTIDTSYIPQNNDVIVFGTSGQRGIVTEVSLVSAAKPATTRAAAKSAKYRFRLVQYNAKCKSSRTKKVISKYTSTYPSSIISADGSTVATKFVR